MVLKDCSRCMVYTPKGKRLREARVVHGENSVRLFFDDYKLMDARFNARVDFYDDQSGLVVTVCELLMRRNPEFPQMTEPWIADCRILDIRDVVQRQRDIRVRVCLELKCTSEKQGDFFITIRNLSAGGMYMTTAQSLDKHEIISFCYCFRTLERRFEAVVLRVRQENGRYGYGCRFVNLTDRAESAVRSFVFKRLMERQRRRESEDQPCNDCEK